MYNHILSSTDTNYNNKVYDGVSVIDDDVADVVTAYSQSLIHFG